MGKVVGAAGTVISATAEVAATDQRMQQVTGRGLGTVDEIWDRYRKACQAAHLLFREKKLITREQLKAVKDELARLRDQALEENRENLHRSSVRLGVIAALNLATNLVPGLGLVLDWGDHIDY